MHRENRLNLFCSLTEMEVGTMSKEVLNILLSAKLVLGALAVAPPTAAQAAPSAPGRENVAAYEVLDADTSAPEFGERGDGQGSGATNCR